MFGNGAGVEERRTERGVDVEELSRQLSGVKPEENLSTWAHYSARYLSYISSNITILVFTDIIMWDRGHASWY
jgi:hypothetical protein